MLFSGYFYLRLYLTLETLGTFKISLAISVSSQKSGSSLDALHCSDLLQVLMDVECVKHSLTRNSFRGIWNIYFNVRRMNSPII